MRVLITGAAGGIGAAAATAFETSGHTVIRHDLLPAKGIDIAGDLLEASTIARITDAAEGGTVDTVVAGHGIPGPGALTEIGPAYVHRVMRINTVSILRLYSALSAQLRAQNGVFVAVSSQAGLAAEAQNAIYSASKFAVVGWAQGIASARDEAPRMRVLCPGMTETPLLIAALEGMARGANMTYEDYLASRLSTVPLGRLGRPSEIGRAAVWLAELRTRGCVVAAISGGSAFE